MINHRVRSVSLAVGTLVLSVLAGASTPPNPVEAPAHTAAKGDWAPPGGRIGYVLTNEVSWGVRETPDHKEECPNGFNIGPREQFAQEFPKDGKKRTLAETQLKREAEIWSPDNSEHPRNAMCSKRCATPSWPGGSCSEPASMRRRKATSC